MARKKRSGASFLLTIGTFIGVSLLFYGIGHLFGISFLMFNVESVSSPDLFRLEAGSFVPMLLGLGAAFIAEYLYLSREKKV
ncbi:hypothetical protein [Alkalicoccus saliphilus]|jgi:hypothetical protein|uniref:Uncharacterized protein n=1 Tax=Alkalicoccus saliphilus TaxID=200989 RepID=A0A2T4U4F2_9BACI|nr:hypothetical protein [Alkalicoccus saliphilus]PTL38235.1 hypothetical protein C6Y45_12595 [Alkalicoccus saliphilus]